MTFPTGSSVPTTNVSSGTGNPANARTDFLSLINYVNQIIASANSANGVIVTNSNNQIDAAQVPNNFSPTGILTLSPGTGKIKIENVLRLQILPKSSVLALTDNAIGDIVLAADDLTGANPKLATYDGTQWRYLDITSLPVLS